MPGAILDPTFIKKLERLSLVTKRPFAGQMKGEKRSVKRGTSVEFADYREYILGDDLRYVDWNMAARLEKLFVKLFIEEEDLYLALLVDTSKSMDFGEPKKLHFAARVAAALGYIGLSNYDRVSVTAFASSLKKPLPTKRGKAGVRPFFDYLDSLKADGTTSFAASLRAFAVAARTRGVAIVLSDFLDPDWTEGLKSLLARGYQVALIHVLDTEEVAPTLVGDLRVIDSETGESKEMSVNPALLKRYQEALETFCGEIEGFASRYGLDYLRATTDMPFEEIILKYLRQGGLIK
jgi:uncharacterized protein (DUF58 family)